MLTVNCPARSNAQMPSAQPLAHSRTKFTRPGGRLADTRAAHCRLAAAAVAVPIAAAAAATNAAAALRRLGHCCCRCHCRCPPAAAGGRLKQGSASRLYLRDATPAQGRFGNTRRRSRRGARRRAAWAAGTRWRGRSAHALTISSRASPARQLLRPHVRTQRSAPPKASGGACWLTCEAVRDARRRGYGLAGNDDEGAAAEARAQRDRPLESSSSACGACGGARRSKGEFERHSDYPRY
jgi:hypothetical protein